MSTPPRRNDPCPCGSGLRYKECHGKLAAEATAPQLPRTGAQLESALRMHREGRIDAAERLYLEVLGREPGNAVATHYLGMVAWHRGDLALAEQRLRASIAADASIADFHNNLGLLLRDTGRIKEALACYRRTLEVDPGWIEAFSNIGLALESAGRFEEAIAAYREAIAREPRFAAAHQNLARALLAAGDLRAGWEHFRWRLAAQGLAATPPDPGEKRFPASLAQRRIALRGEQGLGDILFFLRFAPELARRGAQLAFRGDARLFPMLERTGLFTLGMDALAAPSEGFEEVFIGDLPWRLDARDPALFAPLRLSADADRVVKMRAALNACGPGPFIAVTWRAGTRAPGPVRTQLKEIAPAPMAALLRGSMAKWISVQRLPREGEREALARELGAPVHDFSAANEDLEEILALLAVADGYVGVSNANTHLRAGLGMPARVLVPYPAEWRWGVAEGRSPWFPAIEVQRQSPGGAWPSHRR